MEKIVFLRVRNDIRMRTVLKVPLVALLVAATIARHGGQFVVQDKSAI